MSRSVDTTYWLQLFSTAVYDEPKDLFLYSLLNYSNGFNFRLFKYLWILEIVHVYLYDQIL